MNQLRNRLAKLEAHSATPIHTGWVRFIQDGDLTPEQQRDIDAAHAAGKDVIIRQIVTPSSN